MEVLFAVMILGVNGLISWWNCRVTGQAWLEVMHGGSVFMKVLLWCGAVQAVVGFSMISLFVLLGVATLTAPLMGIEEYMPLVWSWATSFWYIAIIIPALATGYILTIHSWIALWRERSLVNMGSAAWNTFASVYNTYNAVSNMGSAFSSVGDMFSSAVGSTDDARAKAAMLAIMLVILAIFAGVYITYSLIKRYEGTLPLPVREAQAA